ncbi:MAG: hypothetical protein MK135_00455 [Polyangiaceae bacterium]|nr:hypothetical protein [Polyangiaceae bacterium]
MLKNYSKIAVAGSIVLALALGLGLASAQGDQAGNPAAGNEGDGAKPSPAAVLNQAQTTMSQITAATASASRQLRQARKDKDIIKVTCLDDNLSQLETAGKTAAGRISSLQAAIASNNQSRISHDSAVLGALATRAGALSAAANQCVGQEKKFQGEGSLSVTADKNITRQDTVQSSPSATGAASLEADGAAVLATPQASSPID